MATSELPGGVLRRLRLLIAARHREAIEGDLAERHARIRAGKGRRAADRWAWRQVGWLRLLRLRSALRRSAIDVGTRRVTVTAGWPEDLRAGVRLLRSRPAASFAVIATVALAVGSTTSVFTVVNGVLLRPLPFPESGRLVRLYQTIPAWADSPNVQLRRFADVFPLSVPTFNDWAAADTGLAAIGAYHDEPLAYQGEEGAEIIRSRSVTSGYFTTLGVAPVLGRALMPADDDVGAPRVVVLSHGLWQQWFAGSADALGREVVLDGSPHTIVGVMPPGFRLDTSSVRAWRPLDDETKEGPRDSQFLGAIGRLAPDVDIDEVAGRLAALQVRLTEAYGDEQGQLGSRVVGLLDSVVGGVRSTLWLLMATVVLVLLVAAFNIAGLLSVTSLERRRELAVRAALGADTGRIVRGLLAESATLAALGGLAGAVLAGIALPVMLRVLPPGLPRADAVSIDASVLAFALAVTCVTAVVVGTLPALQAARTEPVEMMRASSRGASADRPGARLRSALVVGEVAISFALLVAAGLLGTSFVRLWSVERGFETEGLVAVGTTPDPRQFPAAADRLRFVRQVVERLEALPGVDATAANQVPLAGGISSSSYLVERPDRPTDEETTVVISVVLDDYFDLLRIPLREGRAFTPADDEAAPLVAMVNQTMASRLWPGESAIGKHVRGRDDQPWTTVVGVVGDVRHLGLAVDVEPKLYLPAPQNHRFPGFFALRVRGDLAGAIDLARGAIAAVSPTTPVREIEIVEAHISETVAVPRFRALFVLGLALLAAALALLGVFSVVSLSVTQRTREIGVRMALGARDREVAGGVVLGGLGLATLGIGAGLLLALPAAMLAGDFLYETRPTEPLAFAAIAVAVLAVTAMASWLPARRAAAVDPATALRSE